MLSDRRNGGETNMTTTDDKIIYPKLLKKEKKRKMKENLETKAIVQTQIDQFKEAKLNEICYTDESGKLMSSKQWEIDTINEKKSRETLKKAQYDINFVIRVLKDQLLMIDRAKFNPRDLPITLSHSIKSLLAFLEVERDNIEI